MCLSEPIETHIFTYSNQPTVISATFNVYILKVKVSRFLSITQSSGTRDAGRGGAAGAQGSSCRCRRWSRRRPAPPAQPERTRRGRVRSASPADETSSCGSGTSGAPVSGTSAL